MDTVEIKPLIVNYVTDQTRNRRNYSSIRLNMLQVSFPRQPPWSCARTRFVTMMMNEQTVKRQRPQRSPKRTTYFKHQHIHTNSTKIILYYLMKHIITVEVAREKNETQHPLRPTG